MDTSKPYVGYRSPRRAERNNDREGAKNAPLAALRGWAAGTAGLPGDIEGLIRMLPGIERKEPVLPTSDFYKEWLPLRGDSPTERAFTELGSLTGGAGVGTAARAAKTGVSAGARGALSAIEAAARNAAVPRTLHPQAGVIKMKGGNWLSGSVEDAVKPLQVRVRTEGINGHTAEQSAADQTINQWLDKKLTKYIKNEMATPEDPVRALAERGVLHVNPEQLSVNSEGLGVKGLRRMTAEEFPEITSKALGKSRLAKRWEDSADSFVGAPEAGKYGPTYDIDTYYSPGFNHLVDELRNATNPQSGLPRELLWKYSDLDKVTVPQAVQRVSDINEWRAAQKAEADLLRANNAATVLHKEYPEGYRWVELKAGDLPEGWRAGEGDKAQYIYSPDGTPVFAKGRDDPRYPLLQDALKYEGDTMGHCVGGYCDDVAAGKSRIYSLRDKKGQPHTTIEITPGKPWNERSGVFYDNPELEPPWVEFHNAMLDRGGASPNIKKFPEWLASNRPEVFSKYEKVFSPDPDRIVQIKGKQNRAPNPEYLPYVQDFVRSGKWSDVGDLHNTGLTKLPDNRYITKEQLDEAIQRLTGEGEPSVNAEWFSRQVSRDPKWWEKAKGAFEGYAAGGLVTYNPAEIDDRVLELMSELESEGA